MRRGVPPSPVRLNPLPGVLTTASSMPLGVRLRDTVGEVGFGASAAAAGSEKIGTGGRFGELDLGVVEVAGWLRSSGVWSFATRAAAERETGVSCPSCHHHCQYKLMGFWQHG